MKKVIRVLVVDNEQNHLSKNVHSSFFDCRINLGIQMTGNLIPNANFAFGRQYSFLQESK